MTRLNKPASPPERMSNYRKRMRAAGLRPVQMWVPDTSSPEFIEKCRQDSLALATHDPAGDEALLWIEEVYESPEP